MSGMGDDIELGVYGEVETVEQATNLPTKTGFWEKCKNYLFQDIPWNTEIKVVLTPHQQKIENEINEFLHQEITWAKVRDFFCQEITFGRKK